MQSCMQVDFSGLLDIKGESLAATDIDDNSSSSVESGFQLV